MPADTAKAQLSMKYFLQDGVSSFLWNRENRQEARLLEHSAIVILGFPFAFILQVYQTTIERENYEVLLFLSNYKSFRHCFCAFKSLSFRPFEILGEPVISRDLKQQDLSHLFQVPFLFSLFRIKYKSHHQQIIFTVYMVTFFYLTFQYCFMRHRLVEE